MRRLWLLAFVVLLGVGCTQADKAQWDGRFFQYTYQTVFTPGQNLAQATDRAIGFALASGGYAVQAGNGFLSLGYRHTAAAAKFAETFKDFPVVQKPNTFTIDDAMAKMSDAAAGNG